MSLLPRGVALLLAAAAAACSPALDWREVRPEGSGLALLMPCRPSRQARTLRLAGREVTLVMIACSAGGQTWALAFADIADPAQVGAALAELQGSAAANVGAPAPRTQPLAVRGATPHAGSARFALDGRLPDGSAAVEQGALFTRGTLVFQATVLGAQIPADAAETFIGSLRFGS